ncbi:hypothetical protein CLU96_3332 [Chryseobacterium sp. 52]|nr:hypothetical protein CLU96_3332 [Chryseobacterium sp. 52]
MISIKNKNPYFYYQKWGFYIIFDLKTVLSFWFEAQVYHVEYVKEKCFS